MSKIGIECTKEGLEHAQNVTENIDITQDGSIAIGENADLRESENAIAIGTSAATETNSIAIGAGSTVEGSGSIAIGKDATVDAVSAVQIGEGTNTQDSTVQIFNTVIVDDDGKIPYQSLESTSLPTGAGSQNVPYNLQQLATYLYGKQLSSATIDSRYGTIKFIFKDGSETVTNIKMIVSLPREGGGGENQSYTLQQLATYLNGRIDDISEVTGIIYLPDNGGISIGNAATAYGAHSIAFGDGADVSGSNSIAIGASAYTEDADDSIAIGRRASAQGDDSIAIGHGAFTAENGAIQIGANENEADPNTAQIFDTVIVDANGKIPYESLKSTQLPTGTGGANENYTLQQLASYLYGKQIKSLYADSSPSARNRLGILFNDNSAYLSDFKIKARIDSTDYDMQGLAEYLNGRADYLSGKVIASVEALTDPGTNHNKLCITFSDNSVYLADLKIKAKLGNTDYDVQELANYLNTNKQDVIDSSHKLSADLVTDSSATNKFVTAAEKTAWNAKQSVYVLTPTSFNIEGTTVTMTVASEDLNTILTNEYDALDCDLTTEIGIHLIFQKRAVTNGVAGYIALLDAGDKIYYLAITFTAQGVECSLLFFQKELDFDTTPTANSTNPVTSGGIKTYVDTAIGDINTALTGLISGGGVA